MKEEYKNIFRQHFDNHESELDMDSLIANIQTKRKKKNKGFVWFFFSGTLILGILVAGLLTFSFNSKPNKTSITKTQLLSISTLETTNETLISKNDLSTKEETANDEQIETKEKAKSKTLPKPTSQSIALASNQTKKNNHKNRIQAASKDQTLDIPKSTLSSSTTNNFRISEVNKIHSSQNTTFPGTNATWLKKEIENHNVADRKKEKQIDMLSILASKFISIPDNSESILHHTLSSLKFKHIKETKPSSSKWSISLLGQSGNFNNQFTSNDVALTEVYENSIANHHFKGGRLMVNYSFLPRFEFAVGLQYVELVESIEWNQSYLVDQDGNFLQFISGANDSWIPNLDEFTNPNNSINRIDWNLKNYNSTMIWSIPFQAKYRIIDRRIKSSIYVGSMISISSNYQGFAPNENLIPQETSKNGIENNAMPLFAGISFSFPIGQKIFLQTEFETQYYNTSNTIIEQRILTYGFNVGLGYHF